MGLRAAVATSFANAAVIVVLAAGLHDVNHAHDEHTPQHVHALGEVFGPGSGAVSSAGPVAPCASRVPVAPPRGADAPAPRHHSDCGVRDPPRLTD